MYNLKVQRYERGNEYAFRWLVVTIFYIVYLLALCVAWRLGLRNGYFCWNIMCLVFTHYISLRGALIVDGGSTSFVWSVFKGENNLTTSAAIFISEKWRVYTEGFNTVILQQPQKASCQPHKQGIFASFVLRHSWAIFSYFVSRNFWATQKAWYKHAIFVFRFTPVILEPHKMYETKASRTCHLWLFRFDILEPHKIQEIQEHHAYHINLFSK